MPGLAPVGPTERVAAFVAIQDLNLEKLDRLLHEVSDPDHPNYGKYLTHDEMYALVGNPQGTDAVLAWLRGAGLSAEVSKSRFGVRAAGPVAAMERAFGATYQRWEHKTRADPRSGAPLRILRAPNHTVPSAVRAHVGAVGLVSEFYENKIRPHQAGLAHSSNGTVFDEGTDDDVQSCLISGLNYCWGNVRPSTLWAQYSTPCTPTCVMYATPFWMARSKRGTTRSLKSRTSP